MFLQLTIKRHPVEKIDPSTMLAVLDLNRATVTPLSAPPRNTCIKACRASVTIRLLNSTPTQRVSRTYAETDVLAADHQAAPCGEDRSLNDARSARLEPCNRYTLERAAPQHLHQGMPSIRHHPPAKFDSYSTG